MRSFERPRRSLFNRLEIYSAIVAASIIYSILVVVLQKSGCVSTVGVLVAHVATMIFCLWRYPVMIRHAHHSQKNTPVLINAMTLGYSIFYLMVSIKKLRLYMPKCYKVVNFSTYAAVIVYMLFICLKRLFKLCCMR